MHCRVLGRLPEMEWPASRRISAEGKERNCFYFAGIESKLPDDSS
jgi:hypothetical protein